MQTTRNAVAVGMVTLIVAVGLYYGLRYISESQKSAGQYRVWAVFPDASGLVEKSRVRIAGIPVGYIESISLHPLDGEEGRESGAMGARVNLVISGDVALYRDAKALRSADSLLGDQFVVIYPGARTEPKLGDGDRIGRTGDAGLLGNLDEITMDVREVTRNLRTVFGSEESGRQMAEVVTNLRDITASMNNLLAKNTETVNRTLENIDKMAAGAAPGLQQIMADLQHVTGKIRTFVDDQATTADGTMEEADATVKEIRGAVAKLDQTLGHLEEISDGVNQGEGTVGRLLKDDKLIDDVEGMTSQAGEFVDGLYKLRTIVGLAGEYNFYNNTLKSTVSLRLQPREDKYYLIEAIIDPSGNTTRTELVVESTHPDDPPQYREVIHKTSDALLFSFMFARRIGFATFRFGIKESSGGLGLDFQWLRDRMELTTDLYRFGDDVYPSFRVMVAMEFLKNLYILGGIDDALNDNRDFFVGAMLRFDDEDLKTMLLFGGASILPGQG